MTAFIDKKTTSESTIKLPTEQVPPLWHWTLERYQQAIDMGVLTENDKVELLFGNLIIKMPTGNVHAATIEKIDDFFRDRFRKKYQYREEKPVKLPNDSQPEPDFVVAYRKDDYYVNGHPTPPRYSYSG